MSTATSPRVLVIEHEWDVDLGLIADRLEHAGLDAHIVGPDKAVEIPDSLDGYAGLIVLGGKMDPVDDSGAPWLPGVRVLLREAVRTQLPTMGVCLGAQLLGMAVDGRARLIPAGPEVGLNIIRPTEAAAADPVLGLLPAEGRRALAWHWWEVTDLPDTCDDQPIRVLAESDECPVHAFSVGDSVWGIQFHLEALGRTAQAWATSGAERLEEIGVDPQGLIDAVQHGEDELVATWSPVIDAWIQVVQERAAARV